MGQLWLTRSTQLAGSLTGSCWRCAESLLKPSFRRDRPPPPSPFAEEEPQSSDNTNSASLGPDYRTDYTSMKQVRLPEPDSQRGHSWMPAIHLKNCNVSLA